MTEQKQTNKEIKKPDAEEAKKKAKKQREREEFKRKYFEYYDDIKISDRQDW